MKPCVNHNCTPQPKDKPVGAVLLNCTIFWPIHHMEKLQEAGLRIRRFATTIMGELRIRRFATTMAGELRIRRFATTTETINNKQ
jgi:hypothetical protein